MTTVRQHEYALALQGEVVDGAKAIARARLAIKAGDLRAGPIALWDHRPAVTAGRALAEAGLDVTFSDALLALIQRFPTATLVMASTLVDVEEPADA